MRVFLPVEHNAREESADRNLGVGKGESRIRKPAPLNATRVRHPEIQSRPKAWPPAKQAVFRFVERHMEDHGDILPVKCHREETKGWPTRQKIQDRSSAGHPPACNTCLGQLAALLRHPLSGRFKMQVHLRRCVLIAKDLPTDYVMPRRVEKDTKYPRRRNNEPIEVG